MGVNQLVDRVCMFLMETVTFAFMHGRVAYLLAACAKALVLLFSQILLKTFENVQDDYGPSRFLHVHTVLNDRDSFSGSQGG